MMDIKTWQQRMPVTIGGINNSADYVKSRDEEIAELRAALQAQQDEHLATHRKLAAETLRADQGWQRYEEANADRNQLRMLKAQHQCNFPSCQPPEEQQRIAAQVHSELYSGETKHYAELLAAVGKLIKAKGRFHTEQNYAALVVAYDAVTTKEPNAKP